MRRAPALLAVLAPLLLAGSAARGAEIDPFYLDLERQARAAQSRGDAPAASRLLRTACFGMLDEPERLAACLLRLGAAQGAAGERSELEATFRRLADLDERFGAVGRAPATPEERRAFVRAVAEHVAPEQWALAPGFQAEIASVRAELDSQEERTGRRRRGGEAEPDAIGGAEEPGGPIGEPSVAEVPSAPEPAPISAPEPDDAAEAIAAARALVAAPAPAMAEVTSALARLEPVALARPGEREPSELAAQLAYRASLWSECARWFRLAGEPPLERPLDRFYAAVCLYESGARAEAAAMLAPVAGALRPTPFVERYRRAILGASGGGAP